MHTAPKLNSALWEYVEHYLCTHIDQHTPSMHTVRYVVALSMHTVVFVKHYTQDIS